MSCCRVPYTVYEIYAFLLKPSIKYYTVLQTVHVTGGVRSTNHITINIRPTNLNIKELMFQSVLGYNQVV